MFVFYLPLVFGPDQIENLRRRGTLGQRASVDVPLLAGGPAGRSGLFCSVCTYVQSSIEMRHSDDMKKHCTMATAGCANSGGVGKGDGRAMHTHTWLKVFN